MSTIDQAQADVAGSEHRARWGAWRGIEVNRAIAAYSNPPDVVWPEHADFPRRPLARPAQMIGGG